jgi:Na+/citrate or Na+/malate symporter
MPFSANFLFFLSGINPLAISYSQLCLRFILPFVIHYTPQTSRVNYMNIYILLFLLQTGKKKSKKKTNGKLRTQKRHSHVHTTFKRKITKKHMVSTQMQYYIWQFFIVNNLTTYFILYFAVGSLFLYLLFYLLGIHLVKNYRKDNVRMLVFVAQPFPQGYFKIVVVLQISNCTRIE